MRNIVAVVDEVGPCVRTWIFYWYEDNDWVELIEFESQGPVIEGIRPHFGKIVEYAAVVNQSYRCVLVRENIVGTIWWLLYYHLSISEYFLLCAFWARDVDVEVERRNASVEYDSNDTESSEFVQLVYDI
jgi:hypothetical protein